MGDRAFEAPLPPVELDNAKATHPGDDATPLVAPGARLGVTFWVAVTWLGVLAGATLVAPWLPLPAPDEQDLHNQLAAPLSSGHLLGTDGLGRDILAGLLHGARSTLTISGIAVAGGMIVGGGLGLAAGYLRGPVDAAVGWLNNVVLAFPGLVLLLMLVAYAGRSMPPIILGIAVLSAPAYARVARASALTVSQHDYVLAAQVIGAGRARILRTEVLPAVARPLGAFALVMLGVVIVLETSLAFLGLSVAGPTWGDMIAQGRSHLSTASHPVLAPSVMVFVTVLATNIAGDTLRSRLDRAA